MADPLQTTVQVQDVPEYLRDYRSALLNAAFRTVFNPNTNWFRAQFPRATYTSEGPQSLVNTGSSTSSGTSSGTTGDGTRPPDDGSAAQPDYNKAGIAAALAPKVPRMLGMEWDPKTRTWVPEKYKTIATMAGGGEVGRFNEGGDIAKFYQELRKNMPVGLLPESIPAETLQEMLDQYKVTGQVNYPGATNPFGVTRDGGPTSSWSTGSNFSTKPNIHYPAPVLGGLNPPAGTPTTVYYPSTGVYIDGTGGGTGGNTRSGRTGTGGGGATGGGGTGVTPSVGGSGSTAGNAQIVPQVSPGLAGTTPENRGTAGYNPAQYATDTQASGLATLLGGKPSHTNVVGPVAPPPQNLIGFGGKDDLNAGLIQQAIGPISVDGVTRARTPSEMTLALAGLRSEVANSGGNTSTIDNLIRQNAAAYTAGQINSPVGIPAPTAPPSGGASISGKPAIQESKSAPADSFDSFAQPDLGGFYAALGGQSTSPVGLPAPTAPPSGGASISGKPAIQESKSAPASSFDSFAQPYVNRYEPEPESDDYIPSEQKSAPASSFDSFAQPDLGGFYAALGGQSKSSQPSPQAKPPSLSPSQLEAINSYSPPSMEGSGVGKGVPSPLDWLSRERAESDSQDFIDGEQKSAVPYYGGGFAAGGDLASFEVGEDGKVKNYRKGGALRRDGGGPVFGNQPNTSAPQSSPNLFGVGTTQTPSAGGIANFWNAANPNNQVGQNIFNAPPVYGNQRILGFGQDFGQYNPNIGFTSSYLTRGALSGLGNLPSVFGQMGTPGNEYVGILPGTDFSKGVGTVNFAADIAGEAADASRQLMGQVPMDQQSFLMRSMPGIQKMGFKSPITVGPLSAPTMQQATGVTAPDPGQVIQGLGGVSPAMIQGPAPASLMPNLQMASPERVSGQTIDMLSRLGTINPAQVAALPNIERLSMGPVADVLAGTISTEKFGQPQAQEYMSPYQRMVTDVQKEEAIRQANRLRSQRGAQAVRAGAFGGTRQAVEEGVAREALQRQLSDIEATGQQRAFEQAQGQFERDRAASIAAQQQNVQSALNAALANQRTGLTVGQENLQAALASQQLGSQQALQKALANQQAAQQAGITQYGTTADILRTQSAQDLQAALANQQAGLTVGQQNLAAGLSMQQLAAQQAMQQALANQQMQQQAGLTGYSTAADIAKQGMQQALQAQMANQQAGLTAGQANLQAALGTQQLGVQSGLEAAKASQAGDLATWQMQLDAMKQASMQEQQQRAQDFQNRLAAVQQAQSGASNLAGLGGSMMNIPGMAQQLELQRLAALQQGGAAVDVKTQQALDMAYQDFINQQNYPYQQMNFLQGILSGVPIGYQTEGVQFQRPSAGGLTGLLTAGAGMFSNIYNK